jgi:hypothetical protein
LQLILVLWTLLAPDLVPLPLVGGRVPGVLHDVLGVAVVAVSLASCVDYALVGRKLVGGSETPSS